MLLLNEVWPSASTTGNGAKVLPALPHTVVRLQRGYPITPPLRFWTGAPCSPQRTWAENDVFECFYLSSDCSLGNSISRV
jgi:hypothetical protein